MFDIESKIALVITQPQSKDKGEYHNDINAVASELAPFSAVTAIKDYISPWKSRDVAVWPFPPLMTN